MTIAITGATGQLGQLVLKHLETKANEPVIALARRPEAVQGVPARAADYTDKAGLVAALEGIDTLLLISSNELGQRAAQHQAVIDAAKSAGVGHIVYTSLLHADRSPLSLAPEHVATEEALKASGLAYTILRNGWYTENYTGSLAASVQAGGLIGSAGKGKVASATRNDYAEAAAVVLTTPSLQGKVYELAGDTRWTLDDLADEVSRQTGKAIAYTDLPQAAYADALAGIGLDAGFAQAIASWDADAANGALDGDEDDLRQLIGRPTTPLADAVSAALA